jgi:hypothetical protein
MERLFVVSAAAVLMYRQLGAGQLLARNVGTDLVQHVGSKYDVGSELAGAFVWFSGLSGLGC